MLSEFRYIYLFFLLVVNSAQAQLLAPVVGHYQGKSAQGMAIYGDVAYLLNEGGHCRALDLVSSQILYEFDLASSGNQMHAATACFGKERIKTNDIPVMYVAEFEGKSRCFVENIFGGRSSLVQTIEAMENGKNYIIQCWVVDTTHNTLYAVSGERVLDDNGRCPVVIRQYRLPRLSEGAYVRLTERDKQSQFILDFLNCLQGAAIRNDVMCIATGFQQSLSRSPRGKRSLKIIDLKRKKLKKEIDLTFVTTNEPEGFDFWEEKALLFCGQEGGIYEIRYK